MRTKEFENLRFSFTADIITLTEALKAFQEKWIERKPLIDKMTASQKEEFINIADRLETAWNEMHEQAKGDGA